MKKSASVYRLISAVIVLAAVITLLTIYSAESPEFRLDNFFSYFTIQSNLFAAVYFLAAFFLSRTTPGSLSRFRGAALLYTLIATLGYWFLLGGRMATSRPLEFWATVVVHGTSALFLVLDMVYAPALRRLGRFTILLWMIYPCLYLLYTFLRGAIINWYPYPFLDPQSAGSTLDLVLFTVGLLAVGLVLGIFIILFENRLKKAKKTSPDN